MNWNYLTAPQDIDALAERSKQVPCLIFKHSTRCSISSLAKFRLEDQWDIPEQQLELYFLDLIGYRESSNYVAELFDVYHESPQILLVFNEECILDASHLDIDLEEIREMLPTPSDATL
jgi:bacillithiol system protein YtxJ